MSLTHFFFSPQGRISRQAFWLGLVFMLAVTVPVSLLIDPAAFNASTPAARRPTAAMTFWNLLLTWPSAAISIKRFNDRDWPHWLGWLLASVMAAIVAADHVGLLLDPDDLTLPGKTLFGLVLAFVAWSLIDNGFNKGTPGPNRYGPDPLDVKTPAAEARD